MRLIVVNQDICFVGVVAGVGHLPAHTIISIHHIKYPLQSPVGRSIQSQKVRPICPVCQLVAYMCNQERIYSLHGQESPEDFLMERSWGFLYQCATRVKRLSLHFVLSGTSVLIGTLRTLWSVFLIPSPHWRRKREEFSLSWNRRLKKKAARKDLSHVNMMTRDTQSRQDGKWSITNIY